MLPPPEPMAFTSTMGDADHVAADLALGADDGLAVLDEGDVAAGAADVDGDEVVAADHGAGNAAADDAAGRAGHEEADGPQARHGRAGEQAARLHDLERRGDARLGDAGLQVSQVRIDDGLHVGVEGGDDGALVLAEGRIDVGGERDQHLGMAFPDDLARAQLVRRIEEGEDVSRQR